VLDCETTPFVDVTATAMLTELARDLAREQARLYVAKSIGQVRDVFRTSGVADVLGQVYPSVDAAVDAAVAGAGAQADPPPET
jgi:hypothetical protein